LKGFLVFAEEAVAEGSLLSAASSFFLELCQHILNLLLREGLAAFGALKQFIGQLVINKIIREVDPIESYGKAVDPCEVLVLAAVTKKIVVRHLHCSPPCVLLSWCDLVFYLLLRTVAILLYSEKPLCNSLAL
jgi:hypothetical protein